MSHISRAFWIYLLLTVAPLAGRPMIIAHRGNSSQAPENTLVAFRQAVAGGADMIEMDVRLTRDDVPVVIHDPSMDRTAGTTGVIVAEHSLKELQTLDVGAWFGEEFAGQRIPTLWEVLHMRRGSTSLMLELKGGQDTDKELARAVLRTLDRAKIIPDGKDIVVGSMAPSIVKELLTALPLDSIVGIAADKEGINTFIEMKLSQLSVRHHLLPKHLDELREQAKRVYTWTVDDCAEAKQIADSVDGLITNRPEEILL